jgi:hypothetical protein
MTEVRINSKGPIRMDRMEVDDSFNQIQTSLMSLKWKERYIKHPNLMLFETEQHFNLFTQ